MTARALAKKRQQETQDVWSDDDGAAPAKKSNVELVCDMCNRGPKDPGTKSCNSKLPGEKDKQRKRLEVRDVL